LYCLPERLLIKIIDAGSPYLPLATLSAQLLPYFDHFIESAVLGIRKPNPEIFRHTLSVMGCKPEETVFLDDIGSNLKAAGKLGIRCIRVKIGKEAEAVAELERMMGMKLSDAKARL
jgi:epoxide hydrolase-like predicted phosphatase